MKICIVLGTRPEIIKLYPIIKECEEKNIDYFIIHTNQHYSENMDKVFLEMLDIKDIRYNLNVGSGSHAYHLAKMSIEIEKILLEEKPDVVLVQGDTNSVLAGGLTAKKLGIKVGHVEAGLRSYDERMPEEINRILVDHIADFLFCPTEKQKNICLNENIRKERIFVVGNTIVDSVLQIKEKKSDILERLGIEKNKYIFMTMHRAENVDDKERLKYLIEELSKIKELNIPVIFPIHPRTVKMLEKYSLKLPEFIKTIEPTNFVETLNLEENSLIIITDSGGLQEEACILKVPCITLRNNTERPETIEVGGNKLLGKDLLEDIKEMTSKERNWNNPLGNGSTGKKIIEILEKSLK